MKIRKWLDAYIMDSIERKPNALDIVLLPFVMLRYIELCVESKLQMKG